MRRRGWRVFGLFALAIVGWVILLLASRWGAPAPLDVSYGDIAKVQAYILPEGSNPPAIAQLPKKYEHPLADVRSDIPSPFPAPAPCRPWDLLGGPGVKLSVWLSDGRRLDYLACRFPGSLKPLYNDAFYWPGTG